MLDPRLYRAALVPVLVAVLVAAFSLENRPRPIGTTLAPDAFDGPRASRELDDLVADFPRRRPGDADDERLAQRLADHLKALGGTVRLDRFEGDTIDGKRDLVNVVATRPGAPGPGIVLVAHRDAAAGPAAAELSGTAALVELARVAGEGRLRRTITFVSTSGGSGGAAGARRLASGLSPADTDAVLVLGDLAGARIHKPFVTGFSNGEGQAPLRLRRTMEAAVRAEVGSDPGGPRASMQWARQAFPLAPGEQGEFGREGLASVLLQVSGEPGPDPDERVIDQRLLAFGRAALRTLYALDNGPDVGAGPQQVVVTQRKVLPGWAVRLLTGALLLPPLLAGIDAFARLRRRREPVAAWMAWTLATALPFVLACAFAVFLGAVGMVDATPAAPVPASSLDLDGPARAALVGIVLVFVLGWLALRPIALRLLRAGGRPDQPGAAIAVLLVFCVAVAVLWARNPFAAALLIPAAHLWLVVLAPEMRIRRWAGLVLVVLSLVPLVLVGIADARSLEIPASDVPWFWSLLVIGGHAGPLDWLLWSVIAGCAVGAALVAVRGPDSDDRDRPGAVTVRGPVTYAGPGSLGGTESALRR